MFKFKNIYYVFVVYNTFIMTELSQNQIPKILKDGIFGILTEKMFVYETIIASLKKDILSINKQLNQNDKHNKNVIAYLIQRNEFLENELKKKEIDEEIENEWI